MFSANYDGGCIQMNEINPMNLTPQGDYIVLEKIDYDEEKTTESGIIIKMSQMLDSTFAEARILKMGPGLPLMNGDVPEVDYDEGDIIYYDVRGRQGHCPGEFDIIRREHVVAVIQNESE